MCAFCFPAAASWRLFQPSSWLPLSNATSCNTTLIRHEVLRVRHARRASPALPCFGCWTAAQLPHLPHLDLTLKNGLSRDPKKCSRCLIVLEVCLQALEAIHSSPHRQFSRGVITPRRGSHVHGLMLHLEEYCTIQYRTNQPTGGTVWPVHIRFGSASHGRRPKTNLLASSPNSCRWRATPPASHRPLISLHKQHLRS